MRKRFRFICAKCSYEWLSYFEEGPTRCPNMRCQTSNYKKTPVKKVKKEKLSDK